MPAYTYRGRPCTYTEETDGDAAVYYIDMIDTGEAKWTYHPTPYLLEDLGFPQTLFPSLLTIR